MSAETARPPCESADVALARLIEACLFRGEHVATRNSTCWRAFGLTATFSRSPLVGVRRTAWKTALREMEWFCSGSSQIADAHPSVRPWWEPWADPAGRVANNYAEQLRSYGEGFDQLEFLARGIIDHPFSRRNVITTWNTEEMASDETRITNCHGTVLQALVNPDGTLHLLTYQRSADVVCGVPHNWIQYWALLLWLARVTDKAAGSLTWMGGDVHVYDCHEPVAVRMLKALPQTPRPPELRYLPRGEVGSFAAEDFALAGPYAPALDEKVVMVV